MIEFDTTMCYIMLFVIIALETLLIIIKKQKDKFEFYYYLYLGETKVLKEKIEKQNKIIEQKNRQLEYNKTITTFRYNEKTKRFEEV